MAFPKKHAAKFKANQFVKGGRKRGQPKKQKGGRKTK